MDEKKRDNWGSSVGFILAAAGSAIGLGNLWKFPYLVGKNGGGAFVLVYLILLLVVGFSITLAEIAVGRKGKSDAYGAYENIKKGWGGAGFLGILTSFLISSYYFVIVGWVLKYLVQFAVVGIPHDSGQFFQGFISSGAESIGYSVVGLIIAGVIVIKGVSSGIEKASKIMMPLLFILMVIVAIRAVTLPGAMKGVEFFLKPDFSKITGSVVLAALGQVFFSLSLGMGIMITYGSYLPKDSNLIKSSCMIPILDTFIALLAGFIVLPAVFAFGFEPTAGPGLIFITLPKVFEAMVFGRFFGFIFFLLVFFAATTTTISLLEVSISFVIDQFKIKRKYATIGIMGVLAIVFIPNALSFSTLENVKIFFGLNFFDFLGYMTDNLFLPIGGLLLCIFVGYVWKKEDVIKEITSEGKVKFSLLDIWFFGIRYIAPIILVIILLQATGVLKI